MTVESKPFDLILWCCYTIFYSKGNSAQFLMLTKKSTVIFTLLFIHNRLKFCTLNRNFPIFSFTLTFIDNLQRALTKQKNNNPKEKSSQ